MGLGSIQTQPSLLSIWCGWPEFAQDEGHESGGDGVEDDRVNKENVQEAWEAEFAVGDVERVGAVLGVPSDKGVEEVGVHEFSVDPEGGHVNGAGDKASKESSCKGMGQARLG